MHEPETQSLLAEMREILLKYNRRKRDGIQSYSTIKKYRKLSERYQKIIEILINSGLSREDVGKALKSNQEALNLD
ncbi:hypothetical protein LCGC14_2205860 [marine sediment metagenome]|uniref:Uncharacterized protein n=1 Tax=marine sediment metagenome TaxID=412755 RepID=A0A0F9FSP2_9ZZZZ